MFTHHLAFDLEVMFIIMLLWQHCSVLGSKITSLNFEVQFSPASEQQSKNLRTTVNSGGVKREFQLEKGVWNVIITSHSSMLLLVSWLNRQMFTAPLPSVFLYWVNFVWKLKIKGLCHNFLSCFFLCMYNITVKFEEASKWLISKIEKRRSSYKKLIIKKDKDYERKTWKNWHIFLRCVILT